MIPLRDLTKAKRVPFITIALILVNVFIFAKEVSLGKNLNGFISEFALVPQHFLNFEAINAAGIWAKSLTLVSALFLHGGWLHVIGNMWYLWIFGDNVEDKLGHWRYLWFYILCGIAGNLAHIAANPGSLIPVVGASGCISGVLGAYFLLFPKGKVVTLLPVLVFWTVAEVPAFFYLGIWFLIQFLSGIMVFPGDRSQSCIAWWAHIGGFLAGIFLLLIFKRKRRRGF